MAASEVSLDLNAEIAALYPSLSEEDPQENHHIPQVDDEQVDKKPRVAETVEKPPKEIIITALSESGPRKLGIHVNENETVASLKDKVEATLSSGAAKFVLGPFRIAKTQHADVGVELKNMMMMRDGDELEVDIKVIRELFAFQTLLTVSRGFALDMTYCTIHRDCGSHLSGAAALLNICGSHLSGAAALLNI
ncbi:hypothetical protein CYMTET_36767, partial [Cymbomonas tetramitiformis]